jgi:hypothetical protein
MAKFNKVGAFPIIAVVAIVIIMVITGIGFVFYVSGVGGSDANTPDDVEKDEIYGHFHIQTSIIKVGESYQFTDETTVTYDAGYGDGSSTYPSINEDDIEYGDIVMMAYTLDLSTNVIIMDEYLLISDWEDVEYNGQVYSGAIVEFHPFNVAHAGSYHFRIEVQSGAPIDHVMVNMSTEGQSTTAEV